MQLQKLRDEVRRVTGRLEFDFFLDKTGSIDFANLVRSVLDVSATLL